jgi:catechol 2,3-dioxygenase-like lactoylglutathione lyase family enzyme
MTRRRFIEGVALAGVAAAVTPVEAAGAFKATWLNRYTYVAPDLKKTRDWYHEVFSMQIGHEEAKLSHMWYGDKGDTLMIIRQAEAGEAAPRIDRFAFTIENWNAKEVEAELKRRGLKPQSDTNRGFWFTDPEGNDIGVFAKDFAKRPTPSTEKPFLWKALSANHIVVLSPDYRKLGDWYKDLLSLRETSDAGRDVYQWFGDSVWIPTAVREGAKPSSVLKSMDHVAYTIPNYKTEEVAAELKRRKMIKVDANVGTSIGINCIDLNGLKTQVCDIELVPQSEKSRAQNANKSR